MPTCQGTANAALAILRTAWSELRLGLVSSALDANVLKLPGGRAVINAMTHDFVRPSHEVQLRCTFSALISGLQTGLASGPVYWPVRQVQLHRVSGACCFCSRRVAHFHKYHQVSDVSGSLASDLRSESSAAARHTSTTQERCTTVLVLVLRWSDPQD